MIQMSDLQDDANEVIYNIQLVPSFFKLLSQQSNIFTSWMLKEHEIDKVTRRCLDNMLP